MGRFSNLEFDGKEFHGPEDSLTPGETRDEHFYLRQGDEFFQSARFDRALRSYSRALEFNANLPGAWLGQVRMLTEMGQYREAALWSDKALEIHRDHPDLLAAKAVVCARSGDLDRAMAFSDGAMTQKGSTTFLWMSRGEVLLAGRRSNVDHCFIKARESSGRDWFVRLLIARILNFYGEAARALTWAEEALSLEAGQAFVWLVVGECRLAAGLAGPAETAFQQAASLDPDLIPAQEALRRMSQRGLWRAILDWLREHLAPRRRPS